MKFLFKLKTLLSITTTFFIINSNNSAFSFEVVGYNITSGERGLVVNCYDSDRKEGDQRICDEYSTARNSVCQLVPSSTSTSGSTTRDDMYICNPPGETYCFRDSDCLALGKNTCVAKKGSNVRFESQFDNEDDFAANTTKIGICVASGGDGEHNGLVQSVCNMLVIVTGRVARGVVGGVVIVVGIMFFFGKVTWSLVLAISLGAGAIFGFDSIVYIITGGKVECYRL